MVDEAGFKRHMPAEMLGQEDIFTKAMIEQQLKNMDKQFDALMQQGIPEEGRG